jgi:hypothetical protein
MSTHPRTQIRTAAIALLSEIAALGGRVTGYRVDPDYELPSLVVSIADAGEGGDMVEPENQVKGNEEMHTVSIVIEIRNKKTSGMDNALDALCLAVEEKIESGPAPLPEPEEGEPEPAEVDTLADLVHDLTLSATTMEIEGKDIEQEVGLAIMKYTGYYRIARGSRGTII